MLPRLNVQLTLTVQGIPVAKVDFQGSALLIRLLLFGLCSPSTLIKEAEAATLDVRAMHVL